jgi:heat shock protein HslJ/uncharacterized membrane protein
MDARILLIVAASALALAACERPAKEQPEPTAATPAPSGPAPATQEPGAAAAASFVNRVWTAAESQPVAAGSLRVFLSDGTLVMTSPQETPAFGSWRYADGRLTIVEEGREYPTDILALTEREFRIRMLNPGEPLEIRFVPAEQPPPEAITGAGPAPAPLDTAAPPAVTLLGTAWRLDRLGGAAIRGGAQPTLEFPAEGRAGGQGSCNRFNGIVSVEGNAIMFAGIAATRKACAEAVMRQEDTYLSALREAVRFEADAESLRIFSAGRDEPLRFIAAPAPATPPAAGIQPSSAPQAPSLAGIWTVVGHHIPGTSAMSDGQARQHYGESLRLTASAATSAGTPCREPRYDVESVAVGEYLAAQYRLAPGSLRPLAGKSRMRVMRVSCERVPWAALGGSLLEVDRDRALAPRDGVFFELERDRDFRGLGQEPGWQLEIRKGAEMRLTYDYGKSSAVTPAPRVQLDPKTGTRTFHSASEANDLTVEIVPVGCEDSMSGRPFPATVTVTLNGRSFHGCGESLATPYQG